MQIEGLKKRRKQLMNAYCKISDKIEDLDSANPEYSLFEIWEKAFWSNSMEGDAEFAMDFVNMCLADFRRLNRSKDKKALEETSTRWKNTWGEQETKEEILCTLMHSELFLKMTVMKSDMQQMEEAVQEIGQGIKAVKAKEKEAWRVVDEIGQIEEYTQTLLKYIQGIEKEQKEHLNVSFNSNESLQNLKREITSRVNNFEKVSNSSGFLTLKSWKNTATFRYSKNKRRVRFRVEDLSKLKAVDLMQVKQWKCWEVQDWNDLTQRKNQKKVKDWVNRDGIIENSITAESTPAEDEKWWVDQLVKCFYTPVNLQYVKACAKGIFGHDITIITNSREYPRTVTGVKMKDKDARLEGILRGAGFRICKGLDEGIFAIMDQDRQKRYSEDIEEIRSYEEIQAKIPASEKQAIDEGVKMSVDTWKSSGINFNFIENKNKNANSLV